MVKLFSGPVAVAAQCMLAIGGIGSLLLAPPAKGPLLIVPVAGSSVGALNAAIGAGARLVGKGTVPGSLIVEGRRDAMMIAVLRAGGLIVAAQPGLCGRTEIPA
ncbi:hypothetical protein COC42_01320 [Sphingomonas spermidinifaciens]|uniref:Uncharacterized protein n=1 Tax=Sphingomonas spermidinifaciens TaxID=1141889 RepID=A0A2A4B623_9SPHN|nr:hypothetical protein [Sphingomonas spermidinifaciens]PCD03094.1 hypothetical protein COC42_01320 [Sphingomonas spermidinifaciens]